MTNNSSPSTPAKRRALSARTIFAVLLTILAIVFIAENHQKVRIRVIVPVVSIPVWAALAAMFIIGGLCGLLIAHRRSSK